MWQEQRGATPAGPQEAAGSPGRLPPGHRLQGLGLLFLAALVGGTYAPTLRCGGACAAAAGGEQRSLQHPSPAPRPLGCCRLAYRLPLPPSPAVLAASRGCLELALLLLVVLAVARRQAVLPRRSSAAGSLAARGEAQQPLLPERQHHTLLQAVVEVEGDAGAAAPRVPRPPPCWPPALLSALEIGCAADCRTG